MPTSSAGPRFSRRICPCPPITKERSGGPSRFLFNFKPKVVWLSLWKFNGLQDSGFLWSHSRPRTRLRLQLCMRLAGSRSRWMFGIGAWMRGGIYSEYFRVLIFPLLTKKFFRQFATGIQYFNTQQAALRIKIQIYHPIHFLHVT